MKDITKTAVKPLVNTAHAAAFLDGLKGVRRAAPLSLLLVPVYGFVIITPLLPGLESYVHEFSFGAAIVLSVLLPVQLGSWGTGLGVIGGAVLLTRGLLPGSSGYIQSTLTIPVSLAVIAAAAVIHRLTRIHEKRLSEVTALALVDHLTGLYNPRTFEKRLEEEWARSRSTGIPMALMVFDVDRFKQINDTLGHGAGDYVLEALGETVRLVERSGDIPFRIGGDEFAVVMPSTSRSGAGTAADRMVNRVRGSRRLSSLAGARVTISLGVSTAAAADSPRSLRDQADRALYDAKRDGRNRYRIFGSDIDRLLDAVPDECGPALHHVQNLLMMISEKDRYTYGHSWRVCRYTRAICIELGLPEESIQLYQRAALVCDVGKVEIPAAILLKTEPLTELEWAQIRRHPLSSARIIQSLSRSRELRLAVVHHHERCDGSGYPGGMRGSEIPLGARILSVADAFDAMCSERPYRPGLSAPDAIGLLKDGSGNQFSPEVVAAAEAAFAGAKDAPQACFSSR